MELKITREDLRYILEALREALQNFDFSRLSNIIFFNKNSFYVYLKNEPCDKLSIGDVLDLIQPFMPVSMSGESAQLFIDACLMKDSPDFERLENEYATQCRIDFLSSIYQARSSKEWNSILHVCESIRELKQDFSLV